MRKMRTYNTVMFTNTMFSFNATLFMFKPFSTKLYLSDLMIQSVLRLSYTNQSVNAV